MLKQEGILYYPIWLARVHTLRAADDLTLWGEEVKLKGSPALAEEALRTFGILLDPPQLVLQAGATGIRNRNCVEVAFLPSTRADTFDASNVNGSNYSGS